ncbi:MAG TPA: hypothetical protein VGI45_19970 [Terracidiphilus sp.]|jgi:hypothetical protein
MKHSVDAAAAAELEQPELILMDPEAHRVRNQVAALLDEDFQKFGASGWV